MGSLNEHLNEMVRDETYEIAVGWCSTCKKVIGPDLSEDVGSEMAIGRHKGHETQVVDEWTETWDGQIVEDEE